MGITAGDIGEPIRHIEFEPIETPYEAPAEPAPTPAPVTTPVEEPVPA